MDAIIDAHGSRWKVVVIDPTHLTLEMVGGVTATAWAYHVGQLDPVIVDALKGKGVMDRRGYLRRA